jgi:hypothetical protein
MNDVKIPKFTVIQYVRNKKRIPYGVLVAIKDSNSSHGYRFGYSLCKKVDRFSKKMALKVALGRSEVDWNNLGLKVLPHDINRMSTAFFDRCRRYYKNGT